MDCSCEKCGRIFDTKAHLNYHVDNNACKESNHHCHMCNKGFTTSTSMYRHMRTACKVKKEEERNKNVIYERLVKLEEDNKKLNDTNEQLNKKVVANEKTNTQLKIEVDSLKKNHKDVTTVTSNSNNKNTHIGNNVANIILVGYGKEDISRLDKNEVIKVLQSGFNAPIKLTETLHFNPKYPEYHNVYISNIKDKYAMTYDGTNWKLTIKEELINKMYDDKKNYIEENLDDFIDSLTLSRKNALKRWLDMNDNNEKISRIKDDMKLLLYNNRSMVEPKKGKNLKVVKDKEEIDDIIENMNMNMNLNVNVIEEQKSKDVSKDIIKDASKDANKDISKDISKDASKDISKDASKDKSKKVSKDIKVVRAVKLVKSVKSVKNA